MRFAHSVTPNDDRDLMRQVPQPFFGSVGIHSSPPIRTTNRVSAQCLARATIQNPQSVQHDRRVPRK